MNKGLRPCEVTLTVNRKKVKKQGWFHRWEDFAETVGESALRGGPAAGQVSCTFGIVEWEDGTVTRVMPYQIRFTDRGERGICPGGCVKNYDRPERFCESCNLRNDLAQAPVEVESLCGGFFKFLVKFTNLC